MAFPRMRHVTHMNQARHTYEWVMSTIWMKRVTCTWGSHDTHLSDGKHLSHGTHWVMSHNTWAHITKPRRPVVGGIYVVKRRTCECTYKYEDVSVCECPWVCIGEGKRVYARACMNWRVRVYFWRRSDWSECVNLFLVGLNVQIHKTNLHIQNHQIKKKKWNIMPVFETICLCTATYVCVYTYIHVRIYICVYAYINIYINIYIYIHMYIYSERGGMQECKQKFE